MTTIVKEKTLLVVPWSVQKRAGIKTGDRLEFRVSGGVITITAATAKTYKPTKAELAAIKAGEAAIARREYVSLSEFLNVDRSNIKSSTKTARKISR